MKVGRLFGIDGHRLRRRGGIVAAAALAAIVTGTLALGFAALAAHIALSRYYEPESAALMVAGSALLIMLIACLVARLTLSRARRQLETQIASSVTVALAPAAFSMARKHTRLFALAVAAGAGFWAVRRVRG